VYILPEDLWFARFFSTFGNMELISIGIALAQEVIRKAKEVIGNLKSAELLGSRVEILLNGLERLQLTHSAQTTAPDIVYDNLVKATQVMGEINVFLTHFMRPKDQGRLAFISFYARLANDSKRHLKKFAEFGADIDCIIRDLGFGVLIEIQEQQSKSCEAIRQDFEQMTQILTSQLGNHSLDPTSQARYEGMLNSFQELVSASIL
jgi:hypothetical protein